jgi:hypothetical protein
MFGFPQLSYRQCEDCGVAVPVNEGDIHECEPERRLEFQLLRLRPGIVAFEADLRAFLASPRGRFELWYAERQRLAAA